MTNNRPSGFANPWFQLGLNIICVVLYELLLKSGASATADPSKSWSWTGLTGCSAGGTLMTWWSLVLILVWLVTFVAGQLCFKRAMELPTGTGLQKRKTISILSAGILLMTISFFLNLGLLQRFDLSYLYP